MKFSAPKRPSAPQKDTAFTRQIGHAFLDELNAILAYTYQAMMLSPYFPALAKTWEEISETEMRHYEDWGVLLRDLGANPLPNKTIRLTPVVINTENASAVAVRLLKQNIKEEESARDAYAALSEKAPTKEIARLLLSASRDEDAHAAALSAELARLERS